MTRAQKIKRWLVLIAPILVVLFLVPNITNAQFSIFGDIAFSVIGKICFGIAYIISWFGGVVVAVVAWILSFVLQISTNIASSPPVKIGFPITLAFANLCFVFAIIVIAMATIVRYQSYGIKQALWRLVAIAILVNFGLVISNAILSFSDSLAFYFLSGVDPSQAVGGANNQSLGGMSSFNNFASALAGAFNPQHFTSYGIGNTIVGNNPGTNSDISNVTSQIGSSIGSLLVPLASILFSIFALIFIIVTLGVLVVMLIVRYVRLGYLLIILPVAWAGFIFPSTKKHWSSWWDSFLSQAFFTPIVLFFLWLTMQVGGAMQNQKAYNISAYTSTSNMAWGGLSNLFTNLFTPVIQSFLQMSVLLGLCLGGIITANKMGLFGGAAAKSLALAGAVGLGSWSKNKAILGATRPLRGEKGRERVAKMQTYGTQGGFWRRLATKPIRVGGNLLAKAREPVGKMVADAQKEYGKLPIEEQIRRLAEANPAGRVAIMKTVYDALTSGDATQRQAAIVGLRSLGAGEQAIRLAEAAKIRDDAAEALKNARGTEMPKQQENEDEAAWRGRVRTAQEAKSQAIRGAEADFVTADSLLKTTTGGFTILGNNYGKLKILYGQHETVMKDKYKQLLDEIGSGAGGGTATPPPAAPAAGH